jgi:hypothetical protein
MLKKGEAHDIMNDQLTDHHSIIKNHSKMPTPAQGNEGKDDGIVTGEESKEVLALSNANRLKIYRSFIFSLCFMKCC